jgi:tetratricopeptide (TPR) repeat protein
VSGDGTVFTFYSFKGGVGRSMALANLAMCFFRSGLKTLIVDWDLEAPGLERFFEERFDLDLADIVARPGLADLIQSFMQNAARPGNGGGGEPALPYPPLADYLFEVQCVNGASLLLLHAGRRGEGAPWQDYARFVQGFDWTAFYRDWEGGLFFEWLRGQLKKTADVILIDSRTGVTEMGGVAVQHLADSVVLLCGANLQNLDNTDRMCRNFASEAVRLARNGRPLHLLVVPARIDDADSAGYQEFIERFRAFMAELPPGATGSPAGDPGDEILIPYLPHFSYRERLLIGDPKAETTGARLLSAYLAVGDRMRAMADDDSLLRRGRVPSGADATTRVLLAASRSTQPATAIVLRGLTLEQFDVRLLHPFINSPNRRMDDAEILQANVVVLVLGEGDADSKALRFVVDVADSAGKPVIPVVAGDFTLPLWVGDRKPVELNGDDDRTLPRLAQAIRRHAQGLAEPRSAAENLVYLSYSREDRDAARQIASRLAAAGINIWLDEAQILPGESWPEAVERAVTRARVLVAVIPRALSASSIAREWRLMLSLGKPILPVITRKDTPLPSPLRDLVAIDLSNDFAHGLVQIQRSLERLLAPTLVKSDRAEEALEDRRDAAAAQRGEAEEAIAGYQQALSIAQESGDLQWQARASQELGTLFQSLGNLDEAQRCFRNALRFSVEAGNQESVAGLLHRLGRTAQAMGALDEALASYRRALEIQEQLGDMLGVASSYHQIGTVAQRRGDLDQALDWYRRSLEIDQRIGNLAGQAVSFRQLGIINRLRGDYAASRSDYERALQIAQQFGDRDQLSFLYGDLGSLALDSGDLDQAVSRFRKALWTLETDHHRQRLLEELSRLGSVALEQGRFEEATRLTALVVTAQLTAGHTDSTNLHLLQREHQALGSESFAVTLRLDLDTSSVEKLQSALATFASSQSDSTHAAGEGQATASSARPAQ